MALAVSAWVYPALPDVIPTHWNIKGEADGFGPKGLAARIWGAGGFLGAVLAAVGQTLPTLLLIAPMTVVPIVYSFLRSKQLERLG